MPTLVCLGAHSICVHCRGTGGSHMNWPQGEEASPAPVPRAFPFEALSHCVPCEVPAKLSIPWEGFVLIWGTGEEDEVDTVKERKQ